MEDTRDFITNQLRMLGPTAEGSIRNKIQELKAEKNPKNDLYIRMLYIMLDRNTIGLAERAERFAMLCGVLGAICYVIRVMTDGRLSIWSQLFWTFDALILVYYFYETRQYPIILPQVANVILSVLSIFSILQHYPDAWSQW